MTVEKHTVAWSQSRDTRLSLFLIVNRLTVLGPVVWRKEGYSVFLEVLITRPEEFPLILRYIGKWWVGGHDSGCLVHGHVRLTPRPFFFLFQRHVVEQPKTVRVITIAVTEHTESMWTQSIASGVEETQGFRRETGTDRRLLDSKLRTSQNYWISEFRHTVTWYTRTYGNIFQKKVEFFWKVTTKSFRISHLRFHSFSKTLENR